MNKKLYLIFLCAFALATLACSGDSVTGSSDVALSSSSLNDLNSSSAEKSSSSSAKAVLCKAGGSTSGCIVTSYGDLWAIGYTRVATKSIAKDSSKYGDRAGELFFETDSIEGGKTQITWDDGGSNPRITEFGMGYLSAIVSLDKGAMDKEPYVNIGFNVAGFDSNGMPISADISDWNGICISYVASVDVSLLLDLGDSVNQKIDFAMPSITLEKGRSTQCFEWKQFVQDESKKEHDIISGENAAKHVVNVLFHVQSSENVVGFEIVAIGTNRDE
jgi:hypothetical protein